MERCGSGCSARWRGVKRCQTATWTCWLILKRSLLDVAGLKLDLEALLGCKVDVVEEASLSPYVREQVLREAQPL
jgi:hypothetical protein